MAQGGEQGSTDPRGCGRPPSPAASPLSPGPEIQHSCLRQLPSGVLTPAGRPTSIPPRWDHFTEFMAHLLGSGDKTPWP